MKEIVIFSGLTLGNFIYAFFDKEPNWEKAFERSFFQGVAILAICIL